MQSRRGRRADLFCSFEFGRVRTVPAQQFSQLLHKLIGRLLINQKVIVSFLRDEGNRSQKLMRRILGWLDPAFQYDEVDNVVAHVQWRIAHRANCPISMSHDAANSANPGCSIEHSRVVAVSAQQLSQLVDELTSRFLVDQEVIVPSLSDKGNRPEKLMRRILSRQDPAFQYDQVDNIVAHVE
ncbi:hypothetical protein AXW67_23185 [Bradyrhizobium neotropicale]|uniref:Uncharacterized protein n=1 Tax=Bradyrhizobium neotropicale TaxID=1497615 RepID=A0A176YUQ6_9BRAD|nr:hypothetical protein AXW67_23185 [Bradyrhizobium neotropicale]